MSQATEVRPAADFAPDLVVSDETPRKLVSAVFLDRIIFFSLVALVVAAAIPYGTAEAWWKAALVCSVLVLTILWLIEGLLRGRWITDGWSLIFPILALTVFSFLQTIPWSNQSLSALPLSPWIAVSADPYQSRFFAMQLLALLLAGVLLFRYANTQRRMQVLISAVIIVAVVSAVFGILRQTSQHSLGFGLPLLTPGGGYGQFVNRNHFAFLMEMAFGLVLGLILGGGVKREHMLIYAAAILPVWTALVLSGSRGGIITMLAQVLIAALLASVVVRRRSGHERPSKFLNIARSLPVRIGLLVLLISAVVIGTLWLGGDRLASRIEESHAQLYSEQGETRVGVSRNEIWRLSWKMFTAHPILGVGLGAYWVVVPAFHDASGTMTPQEAHNDYLELLASGGIVGAAIFAWFAFAVLRRTRENLRSPNRFRRAACLGASIGIAGIAVHSLVDFGLHMLANALIFTTLIVLATSKPSWAVHSSRK
ncbi:MAG TPA: O-antigen ligase family protein [Pyrinomonadaceae bacterium]|nr:O-antigen ligase family protein [Pyrinomonadaceae bacterium]